MPDGWYLAFARLWSQADNTPHQAYRQESPHQETGSCQLYQNDRGGVTSVPKARCAPAPSLRRWSSRMECMVVRKAFQVLIWPRRGTAWARSGSYSVSTAACADERAGPCSMAYASPWTLWTVARVLGCSRERGPGCRGALLHCVQEFLHIQWLLKRALAECLGRSEPALFARDSNDLGCGKSASQFLDHLETIHHRHLDVGNHQISWRSPIVP